MMTVSLREWAAHLGVVDDEDAVSVLRSLVGRLEDAQAEIGYVRHMVVGDPAMHACTAMVALDQAMAALIEVTYRFQRHERGHR
jgi:hypothetical protein